MPGHSEFIHKPVAAVNLGTVSGVVHGRLAGDQLGDRRLLLERLTGQHQRRGVVVGGAGGVGAGFHPRDGERDGLVPADRLTECLAFPRVLDALVDASLRGAGGQRGDRDAALVEDAQEVGVAAAAFTEQILFRHPHVVEAQRMGIRGVPADLVVGGFRGESRRRHRDQDRGDLFLTIALAGHGRDGDQLGDVGAGVGDELLGAVDHPLAVVELRGGLGRAGVGAAPRFGETERAQSTTTGQLRQPFPLLLVGAEPVDGHGAQRHARLQRDRHTLVDLAQLLQCQAQGEVVTAHAAPLLGERQTEQTHIGHAGDDFVGERVFGVVPCGHRRDDALGEVADRLGQLLVFVRECPGRQEITHERRPLLVMLRYCSRQSGPAADPP